MHRIGLGNAAHLHSIQKLKFIHFKSNKSTERSHWGTSYNGAISLKVRKFQSKI